MAEIYIKEDVDFAVSQAIDDGFINKNQVENILKTINEIINHQDLKPFYTQDYTIYNERDILTSSGQIIRPDRLAIKDNHVTIIDYKTGLPNPKYEEQLDMYANYLKEMGYVISNKMLVYVNETIKVSTFN